MEKYNVVVVGAGVTGAALAYELARYTDIKNIAIVEKYDDVGTLNSNSRGNSQTIHYGDIETNYSLEKAMKTKTTANMIVKYCTQYGHENSMMFSHQKIAMGVGDKEVEFIKNRYETFSEHFPNMRLIDKDSLKKIEPNVILDRFGNNRKENIIAMGSTNEWTTIDYGKMAYSLIDNTLKTKNKKIDLFLKSPVLDIQKQNDESFVLRLSDKKICADFVIVNAGAYSLYLAHKMGYGSNYGCLPITGSFYLSKKKLLNGKVYMVQNDKLPFAALHGDPDITMNGATRLGPTAIMLPRLERFKSGSFIDFWKTLKLDSVSMGIIMDLFKDADIRRFILDNIIYETPLINKKYFTKKVRKIIPSLKENDIHYAKGFGGIRPQILDKENNTMLLSESFIDTKEGIIFNMTPSPGATSCLGNGIRDVENIALYLNKTFYKDKFKEELGGF